jgi:hypothetical protein
MPSGWQGSRGLGALHQPRLEKMPTMIAAKEMAQRGPKKRAKPVHAPFKVAPPPSAKYAAMATRIAVMDAKSSGRRRRAMSRPSPALSIVQRKMEMEAAGARDRRRDAIAASAVIALGQTRGTALQRTAKGTASSAAPHKRSNVTLRCACKFALTICMGIPFCMRMLLLIKAAWQAISPYNFMILPAWVLILQSTLYGSLKEQGV